MRLPVAAVPRATCRLQLHRGFGFADVIPLLDDLAGLGISHLYTSPIMMARPGSTHGYDIVDHTRINPELGGDEGLVALATAARQRGMGLIVDIVPNHMGIGSDNRWWMDVLEWGPASVYAGYFDINWNSSRRNLQGKVLLPQLGDQFGRVLERGELTLRVDPEIGRLRVHYYEHRFPISPLHYASALETWPQSLSDEAQAAVRALLARFAALERIDDVLQQRETAEGCFADLAALLQREAEVAAALDQLLQGYLGHPEAPATWDRLGRLLDAQAYRLAYWRVAADEINYRRFFDINDLGALRVEEVELFSITHRRILRYVEDGLVDGLRVDHIDGLLDPSQYCRRLQAHGGHAEKPLYIVVEKILAPHERLPDDWPVAGTTGYDALNLLSDLFTDPEGREALERLHTRFTGFAERFDVLLHGCKRLVLRTALASELSVLADEMHRLSASAWRSRDFSLNSVRRALEELIAWFPVYRTYLAREKPLSLADRRHLDWAAGLARKQAGPVDTSILDFLHGVLSGDLAGQGSVYPRDAVLAVAMRFQQLSGPVMAKGLEDTSFYRYFCLLSHNEVGGDPRRWSLSLNAFHEANLQRLAELPDSMLAATTHDTKRGEDARARLLCLAGMPEAWRHAVVRWARMNRRLRHGADDDSGAAMPARDHEYLFYQMLLGCWPPTLSVDDAAALAGLAARVDAAMIKSVREGKHRSSWTNPQPDYEAAISAFVRGALDPQRSALFLQDFRSLVLTVAEQGARVSLAQTLLRLTMPGVPDLYQGAHGWELSLVDPDNRRPLDAADLHAALECARQTFADPQQRGARWRALQAAWPTGRVKAALIHRVLQLRAQFPALFARGGYEPLLATGPGADEIIAFERRSRARRLLVVVPRFGLRQASEPAQTAWAGTSLALEAGTFESLLGDQRVTVDADSPVPASTLLDGGWVGLWWSETDQVS